MVVVMPNPPLTPLSIHLRYDLAIGLEQQVGADLSNALFDLLHSLETHGSIKAAAQSKGQSYRHVWGALKHWEELLGQELIVWQRGRRAALTPYSLRLVWAERQARVRMTPHLEALRAELAQVVREAHDSQLHFLSVAASHDLGLVRLQALSSEQGLLHMKTRFTGSEQALRDLNDGVCELAGFHVPRLTKASEVFKAALSRHLQPGEHKLISAHRRMQGWMTRYQPPGGPGSQMDGWSMLQAPGTRLVNRQPGSGTRLLLDHLLTERGVEGEAIDGYHSRVEHTHVAVATMIAGGMADIGLGVEAVARDFGLHFEPLVEEDYYLVCLKDQLERDPVLRLRHLLAQASWADELQRLPGYVADQPGAVLSLVQALPWWHFDDPRRHIAVSATRTDKAR